ncbi:hypothetical protein [Hamadaea tsunoensis]|uniref:hypothetical protein n=1 Tax=Hamadaea tsunoensis TaxID=53368 RepID=UPI0003FF690B|nr:hypothetical protein [Hamadaea tsunoensis]
MTTVDDASRAHRIAGGLALVAAPVFLLAGGISHGADQPGALAQLTRVRADPGRWYVAHLLMIIGFALLIPAALQLIRPIRRGAPRVHLVAVVLIGLGGIAMIAQIVLDGFGQWLLAQAGDPTTGGLLLERLRSAPELVIPTARLSGPLAVGLFWCAFGLWKTKTAPGWQVAVLGVASVALMAAIAGGLAPAMAVAFVCLAVVMVPTGVREMASGVRAPAVPPLSAAPAELAETAAR